MHGRRETAAALAGDGATVVLGCRNLEKAEEVVKEIRRRHPQAQVVVGPEPLDLARPDSVRYAPLTLQVTKRCGNDLGTLGCAAN